MTTRSDTPTPPVRSSGPTRARAWLTAWVTAWLTAYVPVFRRHRPRVALAVRAWLPGWVLRLVLAGSVPALTSLVGGGSITWLVVAVLAVLVLGWPAGAAPGAAVVFLALLTATRPEPPSPSVVAALLAGLPALVQLGALIGRAGWSARIELSALLVPLPRFLLIQAVVQPLALVGGWIAGQDVLAGSGWILLPLLAGLGLGVISYAWLPSLRPRADRG